MKAKLNLDTAKLKDFAIRHTEKVVFGIFAVVLLYFAYSGFLHETYDQSPTDLNGLITEARTHISTSTPPADVNETAAPVIDIEQNLAPKELTAFATKELVRPNIRDLGSKRGNPVILPPTSLHVSAGNGTVKLANPKQKPKPANENEELKAQVDTRGVAWATITGVVALDEQLDEYNEAFASAIEKQSGDNEPKYIFHQVQRQQIDADGTAGPWRDISTSGIKKMIALWAGTNQREQEMIDAKHIRREVCLALPPIIGHAFGEETLHPDLIEVEEETEEEEPEEAELDPDLVGPDRPDLPPDPGKKQPAEKKVEEEGELNKLLFRFFDFTAVPGKTYRYRGRLWVMNPNYQVEERHLAEQNFVFEGKSLLTNKEQYLKSNWGLPSPRVTVPFFGRIYAGEFVEGGSRGDSMNMPVAVLEPKTGYELLDAIPLHRGQLANFKEGDPLVIKASSDRNSGERIEDTELDTNHFVLDFLPKDSLGEHHAVVMGPDLKLRVVHESEELATRIADLEATASDNPLESDDDASDDPFGGIKLK